jgi:hypothetical protein
MELPATEPLPTRPTDPATPRRAGVPHLRRRPATLVLAGLLTALLVVALVASHAPGDPPAHAVGYVAGRVASVITPTPAPSPSPSPGPPALTAPTRPARPPALDRDDATGAAAAAQYAFALSSWGLVSGEHDEFDALCPPAGSSWCRGESDRAREVASGRATFSGCAGRTALVSTEPEPEPEQESGHEPAPGAGMFMVEVALTQDDCLRTAGDDTTLYPGGGTADLVTVEVAHSTAGWRITRAQLAG